MEYAKFIKSHPLPEITEEQRNTAATLELPRTYYNNYFFMYTADIVDGMLVIMTYDKDKSGGLVQTRRHIFDGNSYATQEIRDGHKLTGMINSMLSTWNAFALDKRTKRALTEYFSEKDIADLEGLEALDLAEKAILRGKLQKKHDKIRKRIDDRLACIPDIPAGFDNWLTDTVLLPFRYFFYSYRRGASQSGYCSHCKTVFEAENVRHKAHTTCPSCHSDLECLALGKISKYPFSNERNVILVQPVTDSGEPALIQRFFTVKQTISDHRYGSKDCFVEKYYTEDVREFLDPKDLSPRKSPRGESRYVYGIFLSTNERRWCECSSCSYHPVGSEGYIYPESLNASAEQIKSANIDLEAIVPHIRTSLQSLSAMLKKYPAAENLAKQGMYKLLKEMNESATYSHDVFKEHVNAAETSPCKFLRIDKPTLAELGDLSVDEFILFKSLQARGNVNMELFRRYTALGLENNARTVGIFLRERPITPQKLIGYIEKQDALLNRGGCTILDLYRDYLSMAEDLNIPVTESTLFPKNVQKEHDVLVEYKAKLEYKKEIDGLTKRGKLLHKLDWTDGTYIIRAFDKPDDFLNESAKLHHCVKTYIKRCSSGETNIYGIRRAEAPEEPFFTLTLNNDAVVTQNLGLRNCYPTKEVKDFVKKWQKAVVDKHKEEFVKAARKQPDKKARKSA